MLCGLVLAFANGQGSNRKSVQVDISKLVMKIRNLPKYYGC
ncbi:hypothetical protein GLIP_2919 [Aliiglaciecola lipolytica E3]|uniref:Uncharacterized protein n=1 Tax=Aliiglaciecola lipolytica E3 TaxID=1127673 RepID=K6YWB3_9ALTE|nr:hypothetical protein GLIP_2919 [Aliiglaciecola lipolytica E3]